MTASVRVFVSHAGPDVAWAEWVAWQLKEAGYQVELGVWDWPAGDNFVLRMSEAIEACDTMVAIWSPHYFDRDRFSTDEWTAIAAARGRTVPLRIAAVTPPAVLRSVVFKDLFGVDEARARAVLVQAVGGAAGPGTAPPAFPGTPSTEDGPRWPGVLPAVWNVPPRTLVFTGRDGMLLELRERLAGGGPVVVQALQGWGGVGKTTLAVEYAHRFAHGYDLVWWVDAERAELIGEQLAALGVAAGWVAEDAPTPVALGVVRRHLHTWGRWLVVFDNATGPAQVREWLPQGPGHVIVTSRQHGWGQLAASMSVDAFVRAESVALLHRLAPPLDPALADRISEALGDLPLGITQAGGVLAETGLSGAAYLAELERNAAEVMAQGQPADYPRSLAAAVRIALDRAGAEDPAAVQLLRVCAELAPEPVPLELFTGAPSGLLPEPLVSVAGLTGCVGLLGRYGLVRPTGDGPVMHRLTQAITLDLAGPDSRSRNRAVAEKLLTTAQPENSHDPLWWPAWARLLPHLLALNAAASTNLFLQWMADQGNWYLLARGDLTAGHDLAQQVHQARQTTLGDDHPYTLAAAHNLAFAHRLRGDHQRAHDLSRDTLDRRRRIHGHDDLRTLATANNLTNDLRALHRVDEALALDQDTLERYRRILGDDHGDTLASANNLAIDLRALGRVEEALALDQDTLERYRRILSYDHPYTLASANNLAVDLRALGRLDEALAMDRDILERRRQILGDDHPETLRSAKNLARDLRALGRVDEAEAIEASSGNTR